MKILLLLFLVVGCASGGLEQRKKLREMIHAKKFTKAHEFIKKEAVYKEEKSKLLRFMEEGMIYHLEKNYAASIVSLGKAKDLSDKLYTKSFSHKAKAIIANDTYDKYYGATYERSMIYFFLSLNHACLSSDPLATPKVKRQELMRARAEVVAWDSFLKTTMDEKRGNSAYKNDMMAKLYGGFIHEWVGTPGDKQIALQLYKDAAKLLFRNYNAYKTFNETAGKFKSDFSKFPKMKRSEIEKKYIKKTSFYKKLKNYIDYKILSMTKRVRPKEFKKMVKRYKPSESVIKRAKKSKGSNLGVVVRSSLIPAKIPQKQYFGLENMFGKNNAASKIGKVALSAFAANTLGLTMVDSRGRKNLSYGGYKVGEALVEGVAIKFELPVIDNKGVSTIPMKLQVLHSGKVIKEVEVPLINPLGDIAEEAISENSAWLYGRLGIRLGVKYTTAIAAAYGVYHITKRNNALFAKGAAVLSYMGAVKAIEKSEVADTRQWISLPSELRMVDLNLPKGKYTLKLFRGKKLKSSQVVDVLENRKLINFGI